jgi:hypothetical protein
MAMRMRLRLFGMAIAVLGLMHAGGMQAPANLSVGAIPSVCPGRELGSPLMPAALALHG